MKTNKQLLMLLGSVCLALLLTVSIVAGCAAPAPTAPAPTTPTPGMAVSEGTPEGVEYLIRFSSHLPLGSPQVRAILELNHVLYEKSGGRMWIEVYPSGQLGDVKATVAMVSDGSIQFQHLTLSKMTMVVPWASLFDYPFLFDTKDDFLNTMEGSLLEALSRDLEKAADIKAIGYYQGGFHAVFMGYGTKPITSIDDLKGYKIRVQSPGAYMEAFKAYGAKPIVLPSSELLTAMEQGVVDGFTTAVGTAGYSMGFADITQYLSLTDHMFNGDIYFVNKTWYESLPSDLRDAFQHVVDMASWITQGQTQVEQEYAYKLYEDAGSIINDVGPEVKEQFKARLDPVYEWCLQEYGQEALDKLGITRPR